MVKESTAFIAGAKKGEWTAHAQKTQTELSKGFQGRVLKCNIWGEGCSLWTDFPLIGWWGGNRVMFQES